MSRRGVHDVRPVSGPIAIGALDLAALLCSRVCHDLISPVGAIVNGLEVMEEDKDEETKVFALDLIKKSAKQASAKLQFCRLAFGAAGSAGAQIDLGDAEKVALRAPRRTTRPRSCGTCLGNCCRRTGLSFCSTCCWSRLAPFRAAVRLRSIRPRAARVFGSRRSGLNARLAEATAGLLAGSPARPGRRPCHSAALYRNPGEGLRAHGIGRGRGRSGGRFGPS